MGGKKIKPENLGLIPLTLPYKTVTVISETAGDLVDDAQEILINEQQHTENGKIKVLNPDVTYMSNGYTYATDSLDNLVPMDSNLNSGLEGYGEYLGRGDR